MLLCSFDCTIQSGSKVWFTVPSDSPQKKPASQSLINHKLRTIKEGALRIAVVAGPGSQASLGGPAASIGCQRVVRGLVPRRRELTLGLVSTLIKLLR